MMPAPKVSKSSALVKHKWPLAAQFVWEVYCKDGMTMRELAAALGMKYFNLNKRASRLVARCGGLVEFEYWEGSWKFWKTTSLGANEARAWVKASRVGEQYVVPKKEERCCECGQKLPL